MKRLKGPELKLSELRVPTFLADVFYDLRDRRLLPLVALVLVAIAAVPFLLGGGEEPLPPAAEIESIVAEGEVDGVRLAVVEATPGLRDYRKRLRGKRPTDPFEQRYTAPMIEDAKLNPESGSGGGGASSSVETTKTTVETDGDGDVVTKTKTKTETEGEGEDEDDGEKGEGDKAARSFDVAVAFQVSRTERSAGGFERMGPPRLRRRVPALTQLPGPKAPVVTTMGVNLAKQTVLLMVSGAVESVFGDASCVSGTDTCQLLEAPLGFPLVFVYGPNRVRYKIKPHSFSK